MAEAEKDKKPGAPEAAAEAAPAKKGPPIKVIGMVAVLMLAEAAGVYVFVGMTAGRTQTASAEIKGGDQKAAQETTEMEIADDKFQNLQDGHVWLWDISIVLKVKKKYEPYINEQLEKRAAEIKEGIDQIIRRAQPGYLREPDLTTINRQLTAYLNKAIEPDPADGSSRIERVMIPKCRGIEMP
jgi:flagellar basal body-associated protein FliL